VRSHEHEIPLELRQSQLYELRLVVVGCRLDGLVVSPERASL
jgi:hypothetical protein